MATKRCTLNLKYQARCIAAQPSSQDNRSRWLAGTTALREHNEVLAEGVVDCLYLVSRGTVLPSPYAVICTPVKPN